MRVVVLDDYQDVAKRLARWSDVPGSVDFVRRRIEGLDALASHLAPYDAIVAMRERTPFARALIERLPRLRLLVTTGMVNAAIDLAAAADRGVTVCGTSGRGNGAPELTWALIFALVRSLPREDASIRAGGWQSTLGGDLDGSTLGILGLGNIGRRVCAVGRALGMKPIAWSENLSAEAAAAAGAERVERDELFRRADVLTIHLVLGDRTRGLVGRRELELMKPSAFLVNTSRGPIVHEAALLDALRERRIAGAGLDVFDTEPLPRDHPLRGLPNTVLTPHIGYVTEATYRVFYEQALEDILAFHAGSPLRVLC